MKASKHLRGDCARSRIFGSRGLRDHVYKGLFSLRLHGLNVKKREEGERERGKERENR